MRGRSAGRSCRDPRHAYHGGHLGAGRGGRCFASASSSAFAGQRRILDIFPAAHSCLESSSYARRAAKFGELDRGRLGGRGRRVHVLAELRRRAPRPHGRSRGRHRGWLDSAQATGRRRCKMHRYRNVRAQASKRSPAEASGAMRKAPDGTTEVFEAGTDNGLSCPAGAKAAPLGCSIRR